MTQTPQNPIAYKAFSLEFPQSLGTFQEYTDVQRMVDTLADEGFPVQNTIIVGTDLKLMERITGRKSWGRVVLSGLLSGMWMGLFIGILFAMFTDDWLGTLASSILMGAIFFTVWSAIGHAFTGGQRDFTSMTATIPMQYELLVEHKFLMDAQKILREKGLPLGHGAFGAPAPYQGEQQPTAPEHHDAEPPSPQRPSYGLPAQPDHEHPRD